MSGVEGSSLPPSQLRLQPPLHHVPQIIRPIANRGLPFSPIPRHAAFDPALFSTFAHGPLLGDRKDKMISACDPSLKQAIGTTDHEVKIDAGATKQVIKAESSTHILPPESSKGVKRPKKQKLSKPRGFVPQTPGLINDTISNALAPSSCRYDSSLGLLTRKFINLLQQAEDGTLDLNRAADVLDVQKRRIYDITNVLEGVNLIEKKLKNMIRWRGIDISKPRELDGQIARLKADIETLSNEDQRLDRMIREMQDNICALNEDENNQKWLYLTQEDICSMPCFEDATLIAIKGPRGTSLEVPDPDEGIDFPQRRYRMFLRSAVGPIDCYLISKHEERSGDSNQDQATSSSPPQNQDTEDCLPSHEIASGRERCGGIMKIVPSDDDVDADYLFLSDLGVSISNSWMATPECIVPRLPYEN